MAVEYSEEGSASLLLVGVVDTNVGRIRRGFTVVIAESALQTGSVSEEGDGLCEISVSFSLPLTLDGDVVTFEHSV